MLKCVVLVFIAAMIACAIGDPDRPCTSNAQCSPDECCAVAFTGMGRHCRDKGEDMGDPCGGPYFCNTCKNGMQCVPMTRPSQTQHSHAHDSGSTFCPPPANGTCGGQTNA